MAKKGSPRSYGSAASALGCHCRHIAERPTRWRAGCRGVLNPDPAADLEALDALLERVCPPLERNNQKMTPSATPWPTVQPHGV